MYTHSPQYKHTCTHTCTYMHTHTHNSQTFFYRFFLKETRDGDSCRKRGFVSLPEEEENDGEALSLCQKKKRMMDKRRLFAGKRREWWTSVVSLPGGAVTLAGSADGRCDQGAGDSRQKEHPAGPHCLHQRPHRDALRTRPGVRPAPGGWGRQSDRDFIFMVCGVWVKCGCVGHCSRLAEVGSQTGISSSWFVEFWLSVVHVVDSQTGFR